MASNSTPNMYVSFNNIIAEQCNIYKGMSDSVFIGNVKGCTKGSMDGSANGKPWSGGWCESGGEEDGVKTVGSGASFHVSNVMASPNGVDYDPAADQSWFKMTNAGKVVLTACRFGGESGGIPLVKNLDPLTGLVSVTGVDHYSAWRPRYVFEALPQSFHESGVSGGAGGGILGAGAEGFKNGLKGNPLRQSAMSDARMGLLEELARPKTPPRSVL